MRALLCNLALVATTACVTGNGTMKATLPLCTTMTDCLPHHGQRVRVEAVYAVWDPLPTRHDTAPPAQQVMLMFGPEQEGPFLGAWGHKDHRRPMREIERYSGKKVRVTGTFLQTMPPHPTDPPYAASVIGPCIHPIERIELTE